jgi:hypothetical protein
LSDKKPSSSSSAANAPGRSDIDTSAALTATINFHRGLDSGFVRFPVML